MKAFIILVLLGAASASPFIRRDINGDILPLIVGGEEAGKGDFPFIVEIQHTSSISIYDHYCGGSIINPNWIVTAAHCSVASINGYTVIAGQHRLNANEGTEQARSVVQIVLHPNYSGFPQYYNDIAVWRVNQPFVVNQWVQVANLASPDFKPVGNVNVAGWGDLEYFGASPDVLMRVTVPMVTDAVCRQAYGDGISAGMICAGEGGKDSCQGDSGGPLVSGNILAGVVSKGFECARPGYPGVYTEIAYYYTWLIQNTLQ